MFNGSIELVIALIVIFTPIVLIIKAALKAIRG